MSQAGIISVASQSGIVDSVTGSGNVTAVPTTGNVVVGLTGITQNDVLIGGATNTIANVTNGTTGQVLTAVTSSPPIFANAPAVINTTFTAGQSGTWTINTNTQWVKVYMWGGGGAGGSGRKGTSASASGGGGGGAGQFVYMDGPASVFTGGLSYSVGNTAGGGNAQTSDGQNGNPGTIGNNTSLGTILALGGGLGAGGTSASGTGGASQGVYSNFSSGTQIAGTAGSVSTSSNVNSLGFLATNSFLGVSMATPGAGGSGGNTATARQAGNSGGFLNSDGSNVVTPAPGGIETGTIGGGNGQPQYAQGGVITGGFGGGGGGGAKSGITGGKGGDGSTPGGGGGGGGGGISTQADSGAGGNGGAGLIIIIEFA